MNTKMGSVFKLIAVLVIIFPMVDCTSLKFRRNNHHHPPPPPPTPPPSPKKPNFIIMLMDDMGWGDLGCYGNPARETPHLDRMASEGLLFNDLYSASAICSPSRASLMTGRLPIRNGFYSTEFARNSYAPQEVTGGIQASEVLIPELLKEAGYKNKIIGKWHLGHREQYLPLQHGFHEWLGAPNCHYRYDDKYIPNVPFYKDDHMIGRYYEEIKIDDKLGISNLTQMYTEEAIDFIERQTFLNEAFFLYWTPDATHTPLYASPHFRGKSKRGLYGDAVMELDAGVGRIMETLRRLHIHNDTMVFFSSDNGAATYAYEEGGSNGPFLCGKQTTFEGGMREPGIAWWPGKIKPQQTNSHPASLMDLLPTLADLAGVELPKNLVLDGKSLKREIIDDDEDIDDGSNGDDGGGDERVNDDGDGGDNNEDEKKVNVEYEFEDLKAIFFYRGNALFNIRYGHYKAHYYTWATPLEALQFGYDYCPGQSIKDVTTSNLTDHHHNPLLFHLGKDPGEKRPIDNGSNEYRDTMVIMKQVLVKHQNRMMPGKAQLDWCDMAVQNWAPKGCEEINQCLPAPLSQPYECGWPY